MFGFSFECDSFLGCMRLVARDVINSVVVVRLFSLEFDICYFAVFRWLCWIVWLMDLGVWVVCLGYCGLYCLCGFAVVISAFACLFWC